MNSEPLNLRINLKWKNFLNNFKSFLTYLLSKINCLKDQKLRNFKNQNLMKKILSKIIKESNIVLYLPTFLKFSNNMIKLKTA